MNLDKIRETFLDALCEGLHYFIPRRGCGKYVDQTVTAVSPGIGVLVPLTVALQAGEGLMLEAFGWRVTAGAMTTSLFELVVNNQAVPGYDAMVNPISPTALDWCYLAPIDIWCPPGSVVRLRLRNFGAIAVTIQARLRGRVVSSTFGTR